MNGKLKLFSLITVLVIAGCNAGSSSNMPAAGAGAQSGPRAAAHYVPEWQSKHEARRGCKPLPGGAECHVLIVNRIKPNSCSPSGGSCGWRPIDLQTRYKLTKFLGDGSGTIVALIELGDLPNADTDLSTYRSTFGLGTAPFEKYNQYGQQYDYPSSCENFGWCVETDLDIEMVAAACPACTIYLIEGGNCSGVVCGLEGAESEAVKLGATILSNSWGCSAANYGENCGDSNFPNYFDTTGVAYVASSGDSGYPEIEWPAALANVLAVGGTQLALSGTTYSESAWDGAGAGCATTTTKPLWQHDPDCSGRTIADISADAGCSPGTAEYNSLYGGWFSVCGTSVAAPLTAGIIGLRDNPTKFTGGKTFWNLIAKEHKQLHVIRSGSDGSCGDYLCEAGLKGSQGGYKTYSGPTGWGTPSRIRAY